MYLIKRKDIGEYKTIHKQDVSIFQEIIDNNLFDKEDKDGNIVRYPNRLELITDTAEIKKVLDEKYSSRSRTEEYKAGLPSATVIASALFPMNIDPNSPTSKFNILRWWNNTSIEDMNAQKVKNKLSTDSGTFIHAILENAMNDNCRNYNKKRKLPEYIENVCLNPEIINMIDNFEDRKSYFVDMAGKTLHKFFENEIENIYSVCNELFIQLPYIQGAIDAVIYRDKKLIILDYKTSKKAKSRIQLYESYARQLYIYSRMLYLYGMISKDELENELEFEIAFFNWNSCNSYIHHYSREEINKSKAYVNFVYSWFYSIMNDDKNLKMEL